MPVPVFTTGEVLTAANMNQVGMWLVKTQTVGAGVSSVSVTNAFSSSFENYKITWTGGTMSSVDNISIQLGPSSVSGYNTSYYQSNFGATFAGALEYAGNANTSSWPYIGIGTADAAQLNFELHQPFESKFTFIYSTRIFSATTGTANGCAGVHRQNQSYTGFTLLPLSGQTFTGGTIRVYGYRN